MPNLSIKDVPDAWAEALRQNAANNHRSLQGELMAIIEAAVTSSALQRRMPRPASRMHHRGTLTVAQVRANIAQIFSTEELRQQARSAPTGTDIIRAERDAR